MRNHRSFRVRFVLLAFALAFSVFSSVAHAQPTTVGLSITLSPSLPGPNETVQATVSSISINLERSQITWTVNGEVVAKGVGTRRVSFSTGPAGTATTLEVVAQTPEGITLQSAREIRPARVTVLWEADTYVPPLFSGKALVTPGASLRLIAIPELVTADGKRIPSEELIYTWVHNGRRLEDVSGFGKYILELTNDTYTRPITYSVEVRSIDNRVTAEGEVTIPIAKTQALLYEEHPLLGVRYNRPLSSPFRFGNSESLIIAEPFYYSVAARDDLSLEYRWTISGARPEARDTLVLRRGNQDGGRSNIELVLRHLGIPLQSGRLPISVEFPGASEVPVPADTTPQF